MNKDNTITIPLSKGKIRLNLIGCIAFTLLGISVWFKADTYTHFSPIYVKVVSLLTVLFFGTGIILFPIRLFSNRGLMLNEQGLLYNVGIGSNNELKIDWKDIKGFKETQIRRTKILLIHLNNTEDYINSLKPWKQKMARFNERNFGAPVSIGSGILKCDFGELNTLLNTQLEKYRKGV